MTQIPEAPSFPFEIHHGSTTLEIRDDWSGHVLIEMIYQGLRRARKTRDEGRFAVSVPAPGSEAASAMLETAELHGFQRAGDPSIYRATAAQIVALMTAAREQGRQDVLANPAQTGPVATGRDSSEPQSAHDPS